MVGRTRSSLHAALLVAVLGSAAWLAGRPLLFPSLGPSAFVLAAWPDQEESDPERVVLAHVVGVVAGLFAYHLLGHGHVVTTAVQPLSPQGFWLAASSVVAIALTVEGMAYFEVRHPPACATTLIVSLGLLSSVVEGLFVVAAVVALVAVQAVVTPSPRWTAKRVVERTRRVPSSENSRSSED